MAYMADRNYTACAPDGSCGCEDTPTSEDYPEPLEIEDAFVIPLTDARINSMRGIYG